MFNLNLCYQLLYTHLYFILLHRLPLILIRGPEKTFLGQDNLAVYKLWVFQFEIIINANRCIATWIVLNLVQTASVSVVNSLKFAHNCRPYHSAWWAKPAYHVLRPYFFIVLLFCRYLATSHFADLRIPAF